MSRVHSPRAEFPAVESITSKATGTISRQIGILKKAKFIQIAENKKPVIYSIDAEEILEFIKVFQEYESITSR